MKFYNKHEADRYGIAEEAIGDMIAKCSRMLFPYYEPLTDEERKIIEKKKWESQEEQSVLNINNLQGVDAVIKNYCPLLKNGLYHARPSFVHFSRLAFLCDLAPLRAIDLAKTLSRKAQNYSACSIVTLDYLLYGKTVTRKSA